MVLCSLRYKLKTSSFSVNRSVARETRLIITLKKESSHMNFYIVPTAEQTINGQTVTAPEYVSTDTWLAQTGWNLLSSAITSERS
jgi:hypothetical protein